MILQIRPATLAVICTLVTVAVATHFRGGSIWVRPSPGYSENNRNLTLLFRMGWRLSRFRCTEERIIAGQLTGENHNWVCEKGCDGMVGSTRIKCSEYNRAEDWMLGANTFTNVFERDGPIKISYSDCCWLSNMAVGSGGNYKLNLEYHVGIRSDTGRANSAPVTATSPMVTLRAGFPDIIKLNPKDTDQDSIRCRLGKTPDECGSICRLFKEFTLNETTCELRYRPRSRTTGVVPIAIILEDYHQQPTPIQIGNTTFDSNTPLSSSPLQFLVNLKVIRVRCFQKPTLNLTYPDSNLHATIKVGQTITFGATSSPCDNMARISEFILIAPSGAMKTPIRRNATDYFTDISWTPNPEQLGINLICVTSRTFQGLLSVKKCVEVNVQPAVEYCRVIDGNQFISFDGNGFYKNISCKYVLVNTLPSFPEGRLKVTIIADNSPTTNGFGKVYIEIVIGDVIIAINKDQEVFVNELMKYLPIKMDAGIWVLNVGKKIVVTTLDGVKITTDGFSVSIGLTSLYQKHVEGLCGNYNGYQLDDFQVGDVQLEQEEFVLNHLADGRCKEHFLLFDERCTFDKDSDAGKRCAKITEPGGCFADCHSIILPEIFYESCLTSICSSLDIFSALDVQLRAYADACQSEGAKICDWRTELGLTMECMPNSHYEECTTVNLQTCADKDRKIVTEIDGECTEGCVCDSGFILSGSSCVPASECGCLHEGQYYHKGFSFMNENCTQVCECVGINDFQCRKADDNCLWNPEYCTKREDGYHDCDGSKKVRATCKAVTDPHYMTFDGMNYDYQGDCAYILIQTKPDSHVIPFKIVGVNERRDNDRNVTHLKEVYVEIGRNLKLKFSQGPLVAVNDVFVSPGSIKDGARIRRIGRYLVADFDVGILIKWDGDDRLRITLLTANLKNEIEGLCGNFDDDPDNDMRNPNGLLEDDLTVFASSWKSEQYSPATCNEVPPVPVLCPNETSILSARSQCLILIDPDGPFGSCHNIVDPVPSYNFCVYDLCASGMDQEMRERVFSSYTQDCLESDSIVGDWPAATNLTFSCPENSAPSFCVSQCQPTCTDRNASICMQEMELLGSNCVEGCICNEGFILSGEECVPMTDCGCRIEGKYVQKGFTFRSEDCNQVCTCTGDDNVECTPAEFCQKTFRCRDDEFGFKQCLEHVRRRATCKAVTDPHYKTFDKVSYDSMGTCSYIMVRSKASYAGEKFRVIAVNENPTPGRIVSHVKEVHVEIGKNFTLSFTKNAVIQINGVTMLPGTKQGPVEIQKVGKFTVAIFDNGMVVKWDGVDRLRIHAWAQLKNQVEGLCGDFNDDGDNDMMTPSGVIETNINRFVESWKVLGYNAEGCPDPIPTTTGPPCVDEMELDQSREKCGIIISKTGPLRACANVLDAISYFDSCVFDVCAYPNDTTIRDRNVDEFDYDCRASGVFPDPWRQNTIGVTDLNCDPTTSFESQCMAPCQRTCTSIDADCELLSEQVGPTCVAGCQCLPGFVVSGDHCVPETECGCMINGEYREKGFTYTDDTCKRMCECVGPDIKCNVTSGCTRNEVCTHDTDGQYKCLEKKEAWSVCRVLTGATYITPNNRKYSIISNCSYVLARTMETFTGDKFEIYIQHQRFKERFVSWTNYVTVKYDGHVVTLEHGPKAYFNGNMIMPGTTVAGANFYYTGRYLTADFEFGLVIKYDGRHSFRIYIPKRLENKFQGLCQFQSHNVESEDVLKLMNTWVHEPDVCTHGVTKYGECTNGETEMAKYRKMCEPIIDPVGRFANCHRALDPQRFFDTCVEDLCAWEGDNAMKEIALTGYTEACHDLDIQPLDWRKQNGFTFACPANSNYARCLAPCQPSCTDRVAKSCQQTLCHEGCRCAPGYIYSGMECVKDDSCGCYIDGTYRPAGYRYKTTNCTDVCTCMEGGSVSCEPSRPCGVTSECRIGKDGMHRCLKVERPRATCTAVTDPHFSTFDGSKYDFQGVCSYILTQTKSSVTEDPFKVIVVHERSLPLKGVSHVKEVRVFYNGHEMLLSGLPQIQVDGELLNLGSSIYGAVLSKSGRYTKVNFDFGLVIRWDGIDRVRVTIPNKYSGNVEGLCGDYDYDESNDYIHSQTGQMTNDIIEFAESWMAPEYSPECVELDIKSDFIPEYTCDQTTMFAKFGDACRVMLNNTSPFANCHTTVDPTAAYNDCVYDLCALGGDVKNIKDRIMSSYIDDCSEDAGGEAKVNATWREAAEIKTVPDCPSNSHFTSCASKCTATCDDMEAARCERVSKEGGDFCVEGCEADDGYILSSDEFVHKSKCGCLKDSVYYKSGDQFLLKNCEQFCECTGGLVRCVKHQCKKNEECALNNLGHRQCQPIDFAECKIWGDARVNSFSHGELPETLGSCSYVAVKSEDDYPNAFAVFIGADQKPSLMGSYLRFVRIRFATWNTTMFLKEGFSTRVNGEPASAWSQVDSTGTVVGELQEVGGVNVYRDNRNVQIRYNGARLYIRLPRRELAHLEGICLNNATASIRDHAIGNCYKEMLPDNTCTIQPEFKNITDQCNIFLKKDGIFGDCLKHINVSYHYENCIKTVCMSTNKQFSYEMVVSNVAAECKTYNAMSCNWRGDKFHVSCPSNSHFVECVRRVQPECGDVQLNSLITENASDCVCDDGFIKSGSSCIPITECNCHVSGQVFIPKGYSYRQSDCSEICTCNGQNSTTCVPTQKCSDQMACVVKDHKMEECEPNRLTSTCEASTGSHINTFDNGKVGVYGSCGYVFTKNTDCLETEPDFEVLVNYFGPENLRKIDRIQIKYENVTLLLLRGGVVLYQGTRQIAKGSEIGRMKYLQSKMITIELDFGLTVQWNSENRLTIEADQNLRKCISGLCGNFDDDSSNEFYTRYGVLETDEIVFINSWHVQSPHDQCNLQPNYERKFVCADEQLAEERCSNITSSSGPFASCHEHVDPKPWYDDCKRMMCASSTDPNDIDNIFLVYSEACQREANVFPIWSDTDVVCQPNSHYVTCMSDCQESCSDKTRNECFNKALAKTNCVAGCECDDGFVLDQGRCIQPIDCGCVADNGFYYANGFNGYISECSLKCQCSSGILACEATSCEDEQYCGARTGIYGCHWQDECEYNNGDCSHGCVFVQGKSRCFCPPNHHLLADNKTCEINIEFYESMNTTKSEIEMARDDNMRKLLTSLTNYDGQSINKDVVTDLKDCTPGWTSWLDRDKPTGTGDNESFELLLKENPHQLCANPVAIEARITDNRLVSESGNILRKFSPKDGLVCLNEDQRNGRRCEDFKVRFLCLN